VRAGGRRGLLWYFAILAVQIAVQLGTALPGYLLFCERSGSDCSPLRLAVRYLYLAEGIVVSAAVIRLIRSGARRPNVFLNGAGLFTLLVSLTGVAYYVVVPRDVVVASAMDFTFNGGAALLAGVVLCLRSRSLAPAVLLAASDGPRVDRVRRTVRLLRIEGRIRLPAGIALHLRTCPGDRPVGRLAHLERRSARAHDRRSLMQVRGIVKADEQDPATSR